MTKTLKIYDTDSHLTTCCAVVLDCSYDEKKKCHAIVLDQTVFFPEGGGQLSDTGFLTVAEATHVHVHDTPVEYKADTNVQPNVHAGSDTQPNIHVGTDTQPERIAVMDVQLREDIIFHYASAPLAPGTKVICEIDWYRRFDFMQQHSAEHILSGLVYQTFGYHNVGFHLGLTETTLDFDGVLTPDDLTRLEQQANQAVWKNIAFDISFPSPEALASLQYRSKKELTGEVRIVTLPGYDICACCAPHVYQTGEIGSIKIINAMAHRGGMRLTIVCGNRALQDYQTKQTSVENISALLSAKQHEVASAVAKQKNDQTALVNRINELQKRLLAVEIQALPSPSDCQDVLLFEQDLDTKAIRDAVNGLCSDYSGICGIFVGNDTDGYRFVLGSRTKDCRILASAMQKELAAKSGGSEKMIQGSVTATKTAICEVFS